MDGNVKPFDRSAARRGALVHIGATKEPAELSLPARLSLNAASLLADGPRICWR